MERSLPTPAEIREESKARVAEQVRRCVEKREARRLDRLERQRARSFGLIARHRAKLEMLSRRAAAEEQSSRRESPPGVTTASRDSRLPDATVTRGSCVVAAPETRGSYMFEASEALGSFVVEAADTRCTTMQAGPPVRASGELAQVEVAPIRSKRCSVVAQGRGPGCAAPRSFDHVPDALRMQDC
jgi:hypothetical protein